MKKYIDVTKEVRQKAMKTFDVSEKTVMNALRFDSKRGETATAVRIRSFALQNGGVRMVVNKEVETIFDADGYMRQYFPNKAVIEVDKKTGDATLFWNGEKMVSFDNIKVKELATLQNIAGKWTPEDAGRMCEPEYRERWKRGVLMCWSRYDIVNHEEIGND